MSAEPLPVAAAGAVVMDGDRILLVRRAHPPQAGLWVVPSGRVEWGETWRETARRETQEETGLDVEVGEVAWVGEVVEGDQHFAIVDFFASVTGGVLAPGSDALDAQWVALDQASALDMPASMHSLVARLRG